MDDDPHRRREEEQIEREAARELLSHIRARAEADEARTQQLLDSLTAGFASEQEDSDDHREAA